MIFVCGSFKMFLTVKQEDQNMYEINVSKNGQHYFATAERSLSSLAKALDMVRHFKSIFPETDGYRIDLQELISACRNINTDNL